MKTTIEQGEKVVLFCHHHATAQELTAHLASVVAEPDDCRHGRELCLEESVESGARTRGARVRFGETASSTFIEWLCSDLICAQTWSWLPSSTSEASLADALTRDEGPPPRESGDDRRGGTSDLYLALLHSRSSRAVLGRQRIDPEHLPGANGTLRVLGVCEPSGKAREEALFLHNQQPDTVISIFNSPFGPDVLVVTDKLSEGIDLHRYCRHLIHYELDPSPIRTVQRNGRLRRVNSWAAATGQPILYAYPAFGGTRDHRLVQIMKKRIDSFSLLLGGVQDFDVEEVEDSEEKWRNDVIATAKSRLAKAGGQLRARQPGET